jgi:hypothetical protein
MAANLASPRSRLPWGRIAAVIGLLAVITAWAWAFSPLAPDDNPDDLDDPSIAATFEQICLAAMTELRALPQADEIAGDLPATEKGRLRAAQIEASTAVLEQMLDDIEAAAPTGDGHDAVLMRLWLTDYRIYLADRLAYAADFRAGIDAPFRVTLKDSGDHITEPVDFTAERNRFGACATPLDV